MQVGRIRLVLIFFLASGAIEGRGGEIHQDFRGKDVDETLFRLQGTDAAARIKAEAEGLRITLPADTKSATVGVAARAATKGDFEITVGYELLRADRPANGSGVGLEMYLNTATPTEEAFVIYRIVRPKEGDVYLCDRKTTNAGKRETKRDPFPAASKSGHLRLTRKGTEVTFEVAEGASDSYRELGRYVWGDWDLNVSVRAWGSHKPVELRLTEVRIRDAVEPAINPALPPPPRTWRLWLLAGLFALAIIVGALLWTWRRTARPDRGGNIMPADRVAFYCNQCGKQLQASAASAGKTVQCPGCGHAVPVPEATA
jgi:hypothetical protein